MKKLFPLSLLFLFTASILFIFFTFNISKKDINHYHKLLNRKTKLTSCDSLKRKPLFQQREGVQKDIFLLQNKQRLHFRICSESSTIQLTEKKDNFELVENLKNIKCLVQDKITYNELSKNFEQQLRYFTAKEGNYSYPSHKFITDSIDLFFFEIPGNTLPDNIANFEPHLKGIAKEVSFLLTDKSPQLDASHFRASFDLDREIR